MDTKARRAQKREQRVLEAHERSKSPKLIGSRVNINSRRYTMASPPKASRFAASPGKFRPDRPESRIDGITRRLSVLYDRRKSLESSGDAESVFSRSRAGDSSNEEEDGGQAQEHHPPYEPARSASEASPSRTAPRIALRSTSSVEVCRTLWRCMVPAPGRAL